MLYYYNESFVDALIDLYPNLGLEKHKFHFMQSIKAEKSTLSDIHGRKSLVK